MAIQAIDWDELGALFGSRAVARGEKYHEQGRVSNLRCTQDHRLVAEVRGGEVYETVVQLGEDGGLVTACTCPVGTYCKHAVAVVFAVLEVAAAGDELPEVESFETSSATTNRSAARTDRDDPGREVIRDWLRGQDKGELIERLLRSFDRSKSVRDELCTDYRLASGRDSETIAAIEREIDALASEDVWYDEWRGEGKIPDYSELELRFKALGEAGLHDALLDLGVRLFERGSRQLGQAHDDGETGMAICDCLEVAFKSLSKSERPLVDRLLLAFDLTGRDEYGIVPRSVHSFLDKRHSSKAWSEVAKRLRDCLGAPGDMSEFTARYRRSHRVDQLVFALDRSRRPEAATELLRDEAAVTWDWVRLVDRLLVHADIEAANATAVEGLAALPEDQRGERAGLRDRLRQFADKRGDHGRVAAFRADEFFRSPSVGSFFEALGAAGRAGCGEHVRSWMERFLCTGRCPVEEGFKRRRGDPAAWPLPMSGETVISRWTVMQGLRLLRDIAIKEQKPAAVLQFHDRLQSERGDQQSWFGGDDGGLRVADAVASTHPDRAIEIYQARVHRLLAKADANIYAQVVALLGKIGKLMGRKRAADWQAMLARLREQHARKRNFIKALDRLTSSPLEVARNRQPRRG